MKDFLPIINSILNLLTIVLLLARTLILDKELRTLRGQISLSFSVNNKSSSGISSHLEKQGEDSSVKSYPNES